MIGTNSFLDFFEKQLKVNFVDAESGKRALDIIGKQKKQNANPLNNPAYKSDYDKFPERRRWAQ